MPITLEPYNPEWPRMYEEVRGLLAGALGEYALDIQHVGSTSVPGLAAKPVIDVSVAVEGYPLPDEVIRAVEGLGYEHKGEYGIPRRNYFRRLEPFPVHVHIHALDNEQFQRHVRFRDRLRANPEAAREYEALKRRLAAEAPEDWEHYVEGKSALVEGMVRDE